MGDVGQNSIEEVDLMLPTQKGLNFGWSAFEGTECYKDNLCGRSKKYFILTLSIFID